VAHFFKEFGEGRLAPVLVLFRAKSEKGVAVAAVDGRAGQPE
jgi:hypothetical protein